MFSVFSLTRLSRLKQHLCSARLSKLSLTWTRSWMRWTGSLVKVTALRCSSPARWNRPGNSVRPPGLWYSSSRGTLARKVARYSRSRLNFRSMSW